MPFSPSGVYTPPTGAENAVPGAVIRSATWNSIFTDIATALTQLGERSWVQSPRTVTSAGNFTVLATDTAIFVASPAATIILPGASLMQAPVRVLGSSSTIFGSNNSVVLTTGTDKISNQGTLTLATNYQVASFYPIPATIGGGYVVTFD